MNHFCSSTLVNAIATCCLQLNTSRGTSWQHDFNDEGQPPNIMNKKRRTQHYRSLFDFNKYHSNENILRSTKWLAWQPGSRSSTWCWNTLSGAVVEPGTIMVFKRLLGRDIDILGMEGVDLVQTEEISSTWHRAWCGHCSLQGMLLCCIILWSMWDNIYASLKPRIKG